MAPTQIHSVNVHELRPGLSPSTYYRDYLCRCASCIAAHRIEAAKYTKAHRERLKNQLLSMSEELDATV